MQQDEEYITTESQEIQLGQLEEWAQKLLKAFPAFASYNYRLYFSGQLISLIGTWLQSVAQGWLVLQLTHSALWVGTVAALGSLPVLIFTLFGGVIVDRFDKKKIIILTQSLAMTLAFVLGILTITHLITPVLIALLAFLLGIVNALDFPARQSFLVEMVGRDKLASAIALNSGTFNGARVVGPGLAGILIAVFGIGGAFILNGISYIAVLIALLYIKVQASLPKIHPHPIHAIKEGITYTYNHSVIRILLLFTGITSIFGWSYTTIMPVLVQDNFHLGVSSLGLFYSAAGLGALLGALIISIFSKKVNPMVFIITGSMIFTSSLVAFSLINYIPLVLFFLFLAGVGLLMQFSTISMTIQHLVADHLRGRVMSIYTLMFIGMIPLGSFQIGFLTEYFGSRFAIQFGAFIVFIFGFYLFLKRAVILKEYRKHLTMERE